MHFINLKKEKEIGVGEDFQLDEIPFGTCLLKDGWTFPGEIEIFKLKYDFDQLAHQFNEVAEANGWKTIAEPNTLVGVETRLPCRA